MVDHRRRVANRPPDVLDGHPGPGRVLPLPRRQRVLRAVDRPRGRGRGGDGRDPRSAAPAQSRPPALRSTAARASPGPLGSDATLARHPARRVRRRRPVAGGGRPLRGHRLLGSATDAGDRGTDGARRDGRAGCRFVRSSKRRSAGTRIGNRACRRGRARPRPAGVSHRGGSRRRSHAPVRRGAAGRGRARRQSGTRAERRGSTHWTRCVASSASGPESEATPCWLCLAQNSAVQSSRSVEAGLAPAARLDAR